MYYEKRKNNYFGTFIIIIFLMAIIAILLSLVNRINANYFVSEPKTEETGTEAIASEFSIEILMKNSIYSVVRNFKIK